jgi:hypothetical protein
MGFSQDRSQGVARWVFQAAVAGLAGMVLWGCATPAPVAEPAPAVSREAAVALRAKARWDALVKADYPAAYAYFSPASRDTLPEEAFEAKLKASKVMYRSAKVDSVECGAEVCKVKLTLTYDYQKFKDVATPLNEDWIIEQGNVWFVYKS